MKGKYRKEISKEEFERIEAYLLNTMQAQQRLQFEEEMSGDSLLRNEVELQQKLIAAVETGAFLTPQQPDTASAQPKIRNDRFRFVWYAAAVVAVLFVISLWFSRHQQPASQRLFVTYFQPDPGLPVQMSSTSAYIFYDGMVSYKEGDYIQAISKWEQVASEQGYSDTLHYYIGVARLNNNEPQAAQRHLTTVAAMEGAFRQKAVWYLALSYLRTGDDISTAQWLKQIPDDERAEGLLKDISQPE